MGALTKLLQTWWMQSFSDENLEERMVTELYDAEADWDMTKPAKFHGVSDCTDFSGPRADRLL